MHIGEKNPHVIKEKIFFWCPFWSGGVISLPFFQNYEGRTVTVNGECYRRIINDYF